MTNWSLGSYQDVFKELRTSLEGLSTKDSQKRLEEFGYNRLPEGQKTNWVLVFLGQFKELMVLILLAATVVSFLLGERVDAITIAVIVLLNAILGFVQEFRAEQALEALKSYAAPIARVRRDGRVVKINAEELVPGDVFVLEAGDRVPADGRIIEAHECEIDEAALTGESVPVNKREETLREAKPLADTANMVYQGTMVTRGRAIAVLVATGAKTEVGKIAHLLQEATVGMTPLQKRLHKLSIVLVAVCLSVSAFVALAGVIRGESIYKMFLAGVSMAVAAIPEGLPAIVTIALAIGVQRMIKINVIVRRLPTVETLGCATVICSDKTGTLTEGRMALREIRFQNRILTIDEIDRDLAESILLSTALVEEGDPTEVALVRGAKEKGVSIEGVLKRWEKLGEIPFSSERKMMTVAYRDRRTGEIWVFSKGAIDVILDKSQMVDKVRLHKDNEEMAGLSLRVLALGKKKLTSLEEEWEEGLEFLALMGISDPPRKEVKLSLAKSRKAGIKTIMVTGDHPATAKSIGEQINLLPPGGIVLTGAELDNLSDLQLKNLLPRVYVLARVTPSHKLRIVRVLKESGHVVAMTGDGVNDAPAVKEADIGIAMGRSGTDVTKEAASLVLLEDNFSAIVEAIEQGRAIYDNIRKFLRYLLSCNTGEILVMLVGTLLGLPLPLLPIHILLVNLVTDGLPALALGVEPPDSEVMTRKPRDPKEGILAGGLGIRVIMKGIAIALAAIGVFVYLLSTGSDVDRARTAVLASLVLSQLVHAFEVRTENRSLWELNLWGNRYLPLAVGSSLLILLGVIYLPFGAIAFQTVPLGLYEWSVVVLFTALSAGVVDIFSVNLRRVAFGSL